MDRERLARLLEEPGKVAREDLADLKELTERYPWFSGAHLLRAAGEQAGGDVLADEAVKACAAHVPSRAVLFDLKDATMAEAAAALHRPDEAVPPEATVQVKEVTAIETPSQEIPEVIAIPEPGIVTPVIPTVPEEAPASLMEVPAVEEQPVTADEQPVAEAEEQPGATVHELDDQILEAALASAYDLTWQERLAKPATSQAALPPPDEPVALIETTAGTEETPAAGPTPEHTTKQTGDSPAATSDPEGVAGKMTGARRLRFTDWLAAESPVPSVKPAEKSATPPPPGPAMAVVPDAPARPVLKGALADPKALIDRFIQKENPAPVKKAEFFTPQQAAKRSLDDSAGLVSETLAKVYEKQGNFQKAMEAYQRLALKYPEKSAYFAALSKELEGKMNS